MFVQTNQWNFSQLEVSECNINFSSFLDPLQISTNQKPLKRLTGLKLNTIPFYSEQEQSDYSEEHTNNLFNDSLIHQTIPSIKKIDVMGDKAELTDLGESSILKFLNDMPNKKNRQSHKNPITDMTINPMIEEMDENYDEEEEPEAYSSNILNALSQSLRSGVIIKKKNESLFDNHNEDSLFYKEFDTNGESKFAMTSVLNDILDDINKYEYKMVNSNFNQFSINDEIVDMINIYGKFKKLNKLMSFINSNCGNIAGIEGINNIVISQVTSLLSKLLSKSNNLRFQSIKKYNKRLKRYHYLQRNHNFNRHYNNNTKNCIENLEDSMSNSLIHDVNFSIELIFNSESETKSEDNSLPLKEIENEFKNIEINQIVTNKVCLEMLNLFENIVTFNSITSKTVIDYNTWDSLKRKEYLVCESCSLLFNFLNIAEDLRNWEFTVKLHEVFSKLLQTSLSLNNFELFSFLIKSQINNYHKRLNRISPADRSITEMNKIENNVWGKYIITKTCVQEFEKLITVVSRNLAHPKADEGSFTSVNKSSSVENELNYTKLLSLKDDESHTQWLQRYHHRNDVSNKAVKKHRFGFLRRLRDKWHATKEEHPVKDINANHEIKKTPKSQSIFDLFGLEKTNNDDKYQSLYILARKIGHKDI